MEKSNREKIAILLHARDDVTTIVKTVRCSEKTVYNIKRRGEDLERREGSGKTHCMCDEAFVANLKAKVEEKPSRSTRDFAKETGTSRTTIKKALNGDLGLKSFFCCPRQLLTE